MKKLLLIAAAFASISGAFARKVTFQVDMSGQTVNADGVHLVGNFKDVNYDNTNENANEKNWDVTAYKLSETSSGSGIYAITLDLADGLVYEYKFVNDNDWAGAESVPAISQVEEGNGNGNRWVYIQKGLSDLTLPAIKFSGSAPSGRYAVVLKVDLGKKTASDSGVHVAGNFADPDYATPVENPEYVNWNPGAIRMVNYEQNGKFTGSVYRLIVYLTGTSYEYKFVNGNDWNSSESVPSSCATGGNRKVTVSADTKIDKVCFGECAACITRTLPKYKVTFQVDMSTACNWDSVDIAGGKINGWAGGTMLKDNGSKVYTVTLEFDSATEVEYKYRKIKAGNPSWEGTSNRKALIVSDTTLDVHCYDATSACNPVPAASDLTFMVDMTNEIVATAGVYVMGTFQDPNWQDGAIKMDVDSKNSNWYTTTVKSVCPGTFAYKFTNGDPKAAETEETFPDTLQRSCVSPNGLGGFNRTYTRQDANPAVIAYVFNSCQAPANGVNKSFIAAGEISVMPNPAEGVFTVVLAGSNVSRVELRTISGQLVRSVNSNESAVRVDASGLHGLFLVNIQDSMGRTATQKVVLK